MTEPRQIPDLDRLENGALPKQGTAMECLGLINSATLVLKINIAMINTCKARGHGTIHKYNRSGYSHLTSR